MQTQTEIQRKNTIWHKLRRYSGLLLFTLILTACSQGSGPQQGVISDDKLSAPLPKTVATLLADDTSLIVDVVVNGDTDNPLRIENLTVDTTTDTFSGDVSGVPTGTSTLLLVYSINDSALGIVEVIRTSNITVNVVANQGTPADFSSADIFYIDTDGDSISNLEELVADTDFRIANYIVGGQVEGLTGTGFVLQNNGSNDLIISENGTFSFGPTAIDGDKYAVSILTQPGSPNQICTVNNGRGTVSGAGVSAVSVTCSTVSYAIGGTVSGYTGNGLVLQNNAGDNLPVSADGSFSFSSTVADGSEYAVTVQTQPGNPNQACTVSNGSGTVNGAVVSNVSVTCSTVFYAIGGTVSGYTGSGLVLQNNGGDNLTITAEGSFAFSSAVVDGNEYVVSVLTQPGNPNQVCTVNNGDGTLNGAAVSGVSVICSADSYTVGGTVSGYSGSSLVLQNNGSDDLIVNNAEGGFTFSNAVADGSNYTVTVLTQSGSLNQMCTVSNASGTVSGAAISSVSVICNTAPTAIGVTITDDNDGNTVPGNSLSGSYTYTDAESDPEGASTFRWLADGIAIAGATTTRYIPVTSDIGKTITFEVTLVAATGASPGAAISSSDGFVIKANSAPFFISGIAISVAEDTIMTGYTAIALDADGDTVTYSLGGGTDLAVFSIDSDSGVLSFNIPTRYKDPADSNGDNTYVVEITATDGTSPVVRSVTVTVTMAILEVSVSAADIKTVRFEWSAYVDATSYKLFVNPDAASGFSLLQDNLSGTSTTITLPVHLTDWINARYILEAHDASGKLTESDPVSITTLMLSGIGYVKASNTGAGDWFGDAISLSADGNTLAVGAPLEDSIATAASTNSSAGANDMADASGAVYVFSHNDGVWEQQAYVKASNTGAGDRFGSAVSLSGDGSTLVVGASREDSSATGISIDGNGENDNTAAGSGAVYLFNRTNSVWKQQAYVKASNTGAGDEFGDVVSLSVDGNTLVVGAIGEDSGATGISIDGSGEGDNAVVTSGAVYVFSRTGNVWEQQAYVKASNTGTGDGFGSAVSLSGDGNMLVVGASGEDSGATGISIDGSGEDGNTASGSGAVYVFSRTGTGNVWEQQTYVKASNAGAGDRFGSAVSLSGDGSTLAVGAVGEASAATGVSTDGSGEDDDTAGNSGAVYVFRRIGTGSGWEQQAYVKASNTEAGDGFGYNAVSLSDDGNTLVVGAFGEAGADAGVSARGGFVNTSDDIGAVYVFSRSGDAWSQETYVKAGNTGWNDRFGEAMSLSGDGNTLVVGASGEDGATIGISSGGGSEANDSARYAGAVYLY